MTVNVDPADHPYADDDDDKLPVLLGLCKLLNADDVQEMAYAAREGVAKLPGKTKGSITYDRKHKSLKERWMSSDSTPVTEDDANPGQVIIERNTQVRVEVSEGRGKKKKKEVKDFRVLALFMKTYTPSGFFVMRASKVGRTKWARESFVF